MLGIRRHLLLASLPILVSTWSDGLFVLTGKERVQQFTGQSVQGLAPDGRGGALFVVDGRETFSSAVSPGRRLKS
jgi:hypothetical protein